MRSVRENDVDRVRATMDQVAASASQDIALFEALTSGLATGQFSPIPEFAAVNYNLPQETTVGQQPDGTFLLSFNGVAGAITSFFTRPW